MKPHEPTPALRDTSTDGLFAGSDTGAERVVIYMVLDTCRLHAVEPWVWLRDTLEKLAGGWKQSRIIELLPEKFAHTVAA